MISHVLQDFVRRHAPVMWLSAGFFILLGLAFSDAEILYAAAYLMPAPWLIMLLHDHKQSRQIPLLQSLPVVYSRVVLGWVLGGAASVLALFCALWSGLVLGSILRMDVPRDLSIYGPASVWAPAFFFGAYYLLAATWPPDTKMGKAPHAAGQWAYLFTIVSLILVLGPDLLIGLKRFAQDTGIWPLMMLVSVALAIAGGLLFVFRFTGRLRFLDGRPQETRKSAAPRKALPGFAQIAGGVLLRSLLATSFVALLAAWFFHQTSPSDLAQSGHSLALLMLYFMAIPLVMLPLLSVWSFIQFLANLRALPLTTWGLCGRLVGLLILTYAPPLLAAAAAGALNLAPGLFAGLASWTPLLCGLSLFSLHLLLRYGGKAGLGALIIAMNGFFFIALNAGPEKSMQFAEPPLLIAIGLMLIAVEVFMIYRLIGHSDAPYRWCTESS